MSYSSSNTFKSSDRSYSFSYNNQKIFLCLSFLIYASLIIFIMVFHEPWFDEAQSWLIARDASYREMLFSIPHYEGHPPFWWLLLSIPAKAGVPYEIGLKSVQVIFSFLGIYLFLFKSPFHFGVRCILPFTYFLFYQYGVISRPYSVLLCGIFLCAICFKDKDTHTVRFVLSLIFLCMFSVYGTLIAGGIVLAWMFELKKNMFHLKYILSFICLLLFALLLVWLIYPYDNVYASNHSFCTSFWQRIFMFFFHFPSESFFTSFYGNEILFTYPFNAEVMLSTTIISLIIWLFLFATMKNRLLYLVIPYILITLFGSYFYFHAYHLGILFLLFLFASWISYDTMVYNRFLFVFFAIGIVINLFWTFFACYSDVCLDFAVGREISEWIKSEDLLDRYKISSSWTRPNTYEKYEDVYHLNSAIVETNPYFEKSIVGIQGVRSYNIHMITPEETINKELTVLQERGTDILISDLDFLFYINRLKISKKMHIVKEFKRYSPWKNILCESSGYVLATDDVQYATGTK